MSADKMQSGAEILLRALRRFQGKRTGRIPVIAGDLVKNERAGIEKIERRVTGNRDAARSVTGCV